MADLLEHEGLVLWIPEVGGQYDPKDSSHYTLMTLTGGMGKGERQTVQERVRLALASQVQNYGRWQGGRPPYGFTTEVTWPHPNPSKAAQRAKAKKLVLDSTAAPVVTELFKMRLEGMTPAEIARALNAREVLCPSAQDPKRNRHRAQDGWQAGTVASILKNGRYTGYEFWGRFKKQEKLYNDDDPSWGYTTRLVQAEAAKLVRSNEPVHD